MKNFLISFILTAPLLAFSQDAINLKVQFKPDKLYINSFTLTADSEIEMKGAKELVDQLQQNGMAFPPKFFITNSIKSSIRTGSLDREKKFPVTFNFLKETTTSVAGDKNSEFNNPLAGKILTGYIHNGRFMADTSKNKDLEEKEILRITRLLELSKNQNVVPDSLGVRIINAKNVTDVTLKNRLKRISLRLFFFLSKYSFTSIRTGKPIAPKIIRNIIIL